MVYRLTPYKLVWNSKKSKTKRLAKPTKSNLGYQLLYKIPNINITVNYKLYFCRIQPKLYYENYTIYLVNWVRFISYIFTTQILLTIRSSLTTEISTRFPNTNSLTKLL